MRSPSVKEYDAEAESRATRARTETIQNCHAGSVRGRVTELKAR